jgi:predicted transcriptional regulator of viral defense system
MGKLESRLFAYAQMRQLNTVRVGELSAPLQLSLNQERQLLSRLARAGVIARVRPGFYLIPNRLPLGGKWSPEDILALTTLMGDTGGRYQICGPNAFNRYGYDEQVPTRLFAYNNRISGNQRIGSVLLTLIKVSDERLGHTASFKTATGLTAVYSSRARTLLDAVYDWSRFDGLPRAYEWMREDLRTRRLTAAEILKVTARYGNQSAVRRIGALLAREGVPDRDLLALERLVSASRCPIPLVPSVPSRGRIDRRWGVIINHERYR